MNARRSFGSIRKNRAGRYEARYTGPDGGKYTAGHSFVRKGDASSFLSHVEAEISAGRWISPKDARERERAEGQAVARGDDVRRVVGAVARLARATGPHAKNDSDAHLSDATPCRAVWNSAARLDQR